MEDNDGENATLPLKSNQCINTDIEVAAMAIYSSAIVMPQFQIVEAGSSVEHSFSIINRGQLDDSYSVRVESASGWVDASAVPTTISIPSGGIAELNMTVNVPMTAALDDEDFIEIYIKGHSMDYARTRVIIKFEPSFSDLPKDDPLYRDVVFVLRRDILKSQTTPEGTEVFRPKEYVTRAEFAHALVQRYAKSHSKPLDSASFGVHSLTDVDEKHPYYHDIQAAIASDLILCEGVSFLPEELVKRGEAVSALMKAIGYIPDPQLPPYFADVLPSHPDFTAIQIFAVKGWVATSRAGEEVNSYFHPDEPITRAELSTIIRRTLWHSGNR